MPNVPKRESITPKTNRTVTVFSCTRTKMKHITTDFMVGLPRIKSQHDAIWVIVDRLIKIHTFLTDEDDGFSR